MPSLWWLLLLLAVLVLWAAVRGERMTDSQTIRIKIDGDVSLTEMSKMLGSLNKCLRACETAVTGEPPKLRYRVRTLETEQSQ